MGDPRGLQLRRTLGRSCLGMGRGRCLKDTFIVVFAVGVLLTGCASLDPTEQGFGIHFQNDLPRAVVLRQCTDENTCDHLGDTWKLTPHDSATDNISDRSVLTRWIVQDNAGRPLGCLPLTFNAKYEKVVVRISQLQPCPGKVPLTVREVQHGRRLGGET
jgi:hypothetical protein